VDLRVLHRGGRSEAARRVQVAVNRRLHYCGLDSLAVKTDGVVGPATLLAVRKAAWSLGAMKSTLDKIVSQGEVPIGVQRMILSPGKRTDRQKSLGKRRVAAMRAMRKRRVRDAGSESAKRRAICSRAKQAAANYRREPAAYHYLAGGTANTVYLRPTPRHWRSDCSQFAAAVYKDAGLPSPGDVSYEWVNTWAIDRKGRVTKHPKPGDLGLYGPKGNPHHVEVYIGEPGCMFIGHGSPPIDSVTPGLPSYYVTFDFLD